MKKVEKLAKIKANQVLKEWIPSLKIHMYWCAQSSTPGDYDDIKQKWLTCVEHIQNIHSNCLHGKYEKKKKWLFAGKSSLDLIISIY